MTASEIGNNHLIEQVLHLINHLIKFGYYGSLNDLRKLLPPLLSLLDGTNDKPFLKVRGEDSEKLVARYQKVDRFVPSPETKSVVDAKYSAMIVLELIMNLQEHTRLHKFVVLFKKCEEEGKNPIADKDMRISPDLSAKKKALKYLNELADSTNFLKSRNIEKILLDLSNYQYDKMVTKSMLLLNKFYSMLNSLFEDVVKAQVVITESSISVEQMVEQEISKLRKFSRSKLDITRARSADIILKLFTKFCYLKDEPNENHTMNQTILVNNGILEICFNLISQKNFEENKTSNSGIDTVIHSTLVLLEYLTRGNKQVQEYLFSKMDTLLTVQGVESQLANTLEQIFTGNQDTCQKITPQHIQSIVHLVAKHRESAPELIDLLSAIVKIEELNLPLKRNQGYVMKFIMQDYHKVCYVLDKPKSERMDTLKGIHGEKHLSFLISLVDLLSTCTEGENRLIESLCQTIFSMDELMNVLLLPDIDCNLKRPYLRFILWTYLNTAGDIQEALFELPHKSVKWMKEFIKDVEFATNFAKKNPIFTTQLLKKSPPKSIVSDDEEGKAYGTLHYIFDASLPFIEVFYKKGLANNNEDEQQQVTDKLTETLLSFSYTIRSHISNETHSSVMTQAVNSLLANSSLPLEVTQKFLNEQSQTTLAVVISEKRKEYLNYHKEEEELNRRLNNFANNFGYCYQGDNTLSDQLGVSSDKEYCKIGEDDELPLGEEFQQLVLLFKNENYKYANKLLEQLRISGTQMKASESSHPEQVRLDIKSFQVLRALIHNEERCLPDSRQNNPALYEGKLKRVNNVIDVLNEAGAVRKTLPQVSRNQDFVVRELLSFINIMLFDANEKTQSEIEDYFLNTREETFFYSVKSRIEISTKSTKEKRLLASQYEAKLKEAEVQAQHLLSTINAQKPNLTTPNQTSNGFFQKNIQDNISKNNEKPKSSGNLFVKTKGGVKQLSDPTITQKKEAPPVEFQDEGYISLILRVLAGMCDGQNKVLQDYLREQPDNIKSFNLVADTSNFLNLLYSNIDKNSISLVIQCFTTLNELSSGNSLNHQVIFDNNVVEYINHILRAGYRPDIPEIKIICLQKIIGDLLFSMIEESKIETKTLLSEISETIDKENLHRLATECYEKYQKRGPFKQDYIDIGFKYYLILERILDITMSITSSARFEEMKKLHKTSSHKSAFNYYDKITKHIEILKDEELQIVRFPVLNQEKLRQEVKDEMKWSVDRSSPSDKIRDLMLWSSAIIEDIHYQQKLQSSKWAKLLVNKWPTWNNLVILLSFVINIIMLVVWDAAGSLSKSNVPADATELPPSISDPVPIVPDWYSYALYALGSLHILFSLIVVITFCLTSRMKLPSKSDLFEMIGIEKSKKSKRIKPAPESKLRVKLISFKTIYFIIFFAMSICGIIFHGYFFAFHLIHICYNNDLLQKVMQAVTLNGKSLLWVTFLGVVVTYIFALIAFATLRSSFDSRPEVELKFYCDTLAQCTASVIRYGLIGEIFEYMHVTRNDSNFSDWIAIGVFHLAFFVIITTIGLNIIFGIILDTFSELRAEKLLADTDMKSNCFICSRTSYEFETHGQGFEYHVDYEHNMWDYIFFFITLSNTEVNDYSNLELYIHNQIIKDKYDFFPLNRAIILEHKDEDTSEIKMEEILSKINIIMHKQEQLEHEKDKQKRLKEQKKWEDIHRD